MNDENERSVASDCSVSEPVAWEVFLPGVGTYDIHSFRWEAAAIAHALLFNEGTIAAVCPLFRQPQPALTAGEREALEVARDVLGEMEDNDGEPFTPEVDAICGLLQRLK